MKVLNEFSIEWFHNIAFSLEALAFLLEYCFPKRLSIDRNGVEHIL